MLSMLYVYTGDAKKSLARINTLVSRCHNNLPLDPMLTDELVDEAAARLGDERLQERERRVAAAARRADGLLDDVEAAVENSRSDEAFVGLQEPEQPGP